MFQKSLCPAALLLYSFHILSFSLYLAKVQFLNCWHLFFRKPFGKVLFKYVFDALLHLFLYLLYLFCIAPCSSVDCPCFSPISNFAFANFLHKISFFSFGWKIFCAEVEGLNCQFKPTRITPLPSFLRSAAVLLNVSFKQI